jgi:hypothetical protein
VANKKATEAMDWNERALSNLAVAFTTPKAMVHFHKAASTEWPDGLACNVVKSLLRKYWPQDVISGIEYENALRTFKLKKGQDPTELFDHITEVNTQYGIGSPDEKKLIALALEKLPERYMNAFTTLRASLSCDPFFLLAQVTITCAHEHHSQFSPWVVKNCIWVCQHYCGLHTKEKMKRSFRNHQALHYLFCIFDNVASTVFSF